MYNIAITKEGKTDFFNDIDDNPRPYPSLADALVSAQYLGLNRDDVELHFIKEGASTEGITQTVKTLPKEEKNSNEKSLEKMSHKQLVAYAAEAGIPIPPESTKADILALIQILEKPATETNDNLQGDSNNGRTTQN